MAGFTLRPTVRSDFDALECKALARVKAVTGVDADGNIVGFGGIAYLPNGEVMAFSELTERAKESPLSLHKAALRVIREAKEAGIKELVAISDYERSEAAGRWLARLGFYPRKRRGETVWMWAAE
jgi:N-acetylglutamate synthase-like GNAT family acetyltransferase